MSGTNYYIVVEKIDGKFDIKPNAPLTQNENRSPADIINSQDNVVFPIKVVQGNGKNEFEVDGVKYSLDLDTQFNTTTGNNKSIDAKNFSDVHKAFNQTSLANNNNNNSNNNSSNTSAQTHTTNNNNNNNINNNSAPTASSTTINPPPPPPQSTLRNTLTQLQNLINSSRNIDNSIIGDKVELYENRNDIITGDRDFIIFTDESNDTDVNINNKTYVHVTNNGNKRLFKEQSVTLGGQKQRRSKRNYSKKQRKQWAKNNTLRNYFNYRESAY